MVDPRENRIHMMLSNDELTTIDDWRFANRIATRSDAIRRLCQMGLVLDGKLTPLFQAMKSYAEANEKFIATVKDLIDPAVEDKIRAANNAALLQVETLPKFMKLVYTIREMTGRAYNFKDKSEFSKVLQDSDETRAFFEELATEFDQLNELNSKLDNSRKEKLGKSETGSGERKLPRGHEAD